MKALNDMNKVEKGYLLAKLFPLILKELTLFIQQETERFRKNEIYMRSIWTDKTIITADFWFGLVERTEQIIKRNNVMLHKSPRVFADQFFDGYNSVFITDCMIDYAGRAECTYELRQAIHFLFGEQKMISITLNNK